MHWLWAVLAVVGVLLLVVLIVFVNDAERRIPAFCIRSRAGMATVSSWMMMELLI